MLDLMLSLLVLSALALLGGAWVLLRRGARRQAWLMLLVAVVMLVNVAIWTAPGPDGPAPLEMAGERAAGP